MGPTLKQCRHQSDQGAKFLCCGCVRSHRDSNLRLSGSHKSSRKLPEGLFFLFYFFYLEHLRHWSAPRCISLRRKGSPQISECPAASVPHSPPCRSSRTCPQEMMRRTCARPPAETENAGDIWHGGGGGGVERTAALTPPHRHTSAPKILDKRRRLTLWHKLSFLRFLSLGKIRWKDLDKLKKRKIKLDTFSYKLHGVCTDLSWKRNQIQIRIVERV